MRLIGLAIILIVNLFSVWYQIAKDSRYKPRTFPTSSYMGSIGRLRWRYERRGVIKNVQQFLSCLEKRSFYLQYGPIFLLP